MKKFLIATTALLTLSGYTFVTATDTEAATKYITKAQAKQFALKTVNGKIVDVDFDRDDRTPHYEIDILTTNEKVEIEVDAITGNAKITERDPIKKATATTNTAIISQSKAIEIAKAKLNGQGTVTDIELDRDNGVRYYEIELRYGKKEYDVKINATTGKIVKFKLD